MVEVKAIQKPNSKDACMVLTNCFVGKIPTILSQ
jgi:hypothetical protein